MMNTCGHGKPIDEFCEACEEMGEIVLGLRDTIKNLEEENAKLRKAVLTLHDKLTSANRRINRMYNDSYEDVTPEREDR